MLEEATANNRRIWDTRGVSSREAFDYYHGAVCEAFSHLAPVLGREARARFHARVDSTPLGGGFVNRVRATTHRVDRSAVDIARGNSDWYYLNLYLGDGCEISQDGRMVRAETGDMALFAGGAPFRLDHAASRDMRVVSFMAPGAALRDRLGLRLSAGPGVVRAQDPLAPLLRETARLLSDPHDALTGAARVRLFDTLFDHAALALAEPGESGRSQSERRQAAKSFETFSRMRAHICGQCADPRLDAGRLAAAHAVSVRYAHKLFANFAEGQTVAGAIAAARLDRAAALLRSPSAQTVTDAAFAAGFSDLSQFYRAFKARFGCAPGQYRQSRAPAWDASRT